jgi:hypothetical protein
MVQSLDTPQKGQKVRYTGDGEDTVYDFAENVIWVKLGEEKYKVIPIGDVMRSADDLNVWNYTADQPPKIDTHGPQH